MDRRPLILIVEDNRDNQELLTFQLEVFNFSYICADNGLAALDLAKTRQPNLILLDIMLPDISGIEVIHYLKQDPKTATIPVIAVTALAREEDRDRCLLAGAEDYITKPYELDDLEVIIRRHFSLVQPLTSPWE